MTAPVRARPIVLHLIANSHLDPVWLWDAREGLNEALATVHTVLALMRERPALRYIRGESLVYEEIRRHAPAAFAEIRRLVRAGRWDPVGGTFVQPDMNLPAVETLDRHFEVGQAFFARHFGRTAWAGWSADCFGHSPFLPDILRRHGLRAYAFGRPNPPEQLKLFWWESPNGLRVLAATYPAGWYGCERDEMPARLDAALAAAPSLPTCHVFVPFGLGNHGGGPTRRHLDDIAAWAARHSEIDVRYSTLHGFFAAVERELSAGRVRLPTIRGDLGFCLRGTYATGLRIKRAYRQAEAAVMRADSLIHWLQPTPPAATRRELDAVWRGVLFNSFHDILPATAIERALDEQREELAGLSHRCRVLERDALLALTRTLPVVAAKAPADHPQPVRFLVVNAGERRFRGPLELEGQMDYRPLWRYANHPEAVPLELRDGRGRLLPFQELPPGHNFMRHLPWRKRIVFEADLAARSWHMFTLGWVERAVVCRPQRVVARAMGVDAIANDELRVTAKLGATGIRFTHGGHELLEPPGLSALLVEDEFGPWGGHYEEKTSLELLTVRERWRIVGREILERGPVRAALWCRLAGARSRLDLTITLGARDQHAVVDARLFFDEERARLKLALPGGDTADFAVPGGVVRRGPQGEVPGGRWVRVVDRRGRPRFIFATDALYNFNAVQGCLYATVVRASRFTLDRPESTAALGPNEPVIDRGEFRFRFLLGTATPRTTAAAEQFEQPPLIATVPGLRLQK